MVIENLEASNLLPVQEGLVEGVEGDPESVVLLGSKCQTCQEVSIGTNAVCLNCGNDDIEGVRLSSEGELYSFTIVRHRPPGNYLGPDPFEPFALGLIELPDGVRVMAPLEGDINSFEIGSRLRLQPWVLRDADGTSYRAFRFSAVTG